MPDTKAIFFDRQEVRSAAEREAAIFHALPGLVRHALDNAPGIAGQLNGIEPDRVASPAVLGQLPTLSIEALLAGQATHPPFGGMVATPIGRLARGAVRQPRSTRAGRVAG